MIALVILWLALILYGCKRRRTPAKVQAPVCKAPQTPNAQRQLLQAMQYSVDSMVDERERLNRECETAIDTKNAKRLEKNAKRIDSLTEQIARKNLQIAKLQDKLNAG